MALSGIENVVTVNSEVSIPKIQKNKTIIDDFSSYLGNAINEVNEKLMIADERSKNLAISKSDNLHDTMIALEKADITFRLLVQVRNKALEAYHQLMQMQV